MKDGGLEPLDATIYRTSPRIYWRFWPEDSQA